MSIFQRPISPDFEDGIDRKQLKQIRDRFLNLNQERLQRTQALLPRKQSDLLALIPLLYHINHPALPGFIGHDCPAGLDCFTASDLQLRLAKTLHHSFNWRNNSKVPSKKLHSVFMMGSAGSIAFNNQSDIDLWLCHAPNLSADEIHRLDLKAKKIDEWAQKSGLELHTFLMNAETFRQGGGDFDSAVPSLDEESSGSAQHFLLLDEFYRTATLLAGRYPLWWLIPTDHEQHYENWAKHLIQKRFVPESHVIDFGHCRDIPASELIGAATWQLYKSLEAPYKSALKLFLAELYSAAPDSATTLSGDFKSRVYADLIKHEHIDPYVALYERIEDYLVEKRMPQRLELARRCFYFKVGQKLSSLSTKVNWQQAEVKSLVKRWGWNDAALRHLNLRAEWKTSDVIKERRSLLKNLSASYRIINKFARGKTVRSAISAKDLKLLGNKLNAQLEAKAGKIERINFGIAPNIFESHIEIQHHDATWRALDTNKTIIHQDLSPVALLCWLYINRVANRQTQFVLKTDQSATPEQSVFNFMAKSLYKELSPYFSRHLEMKQFASQARTEHIVLIINEGHHTPSRIDKQGNMRLSNQDNVLKYGVQQENLIKSIDLVKVNSWQEITVERFEHGQPLLQAMMAWTKECTTKPANTLNTAVLCFDPQWGQALKNRVESLCRALSDAFFPAFVLNKGRFLVEIGKDLHVIESDGASLTHLSFDDFDSFALYTKNLTDPSQDNWSVEEKSLQNHLLLREALVSSHPRQDEVYLQAKGKQLHCCVHTKSGSVFELTLAEHAPKQLTTERIVHFFNTACDGKVSIYESKAKGRGQLKHQSIPRSAYREALKQDLTELSINFSQKQNKTNAAARVAQTYFGDILNNRKSALATLSFLDNVDLEAEWLPTPNFKSQDWPDGRPDLIQLLEIYYQLSNNLRKRDSTR